MIRPILSLLLMCATFAVQAQTLGNPKAVVYSIDIHADRQWLAAISDKDRLELWNYTEKKLVKSWTLNSMGIGVALGPKGIAVIRTDGKAEIYHPESFELIGSLNISKEGSLTKIKSLPDSTFAISDDGGNVFHLSANTSEWKVSKLFSYTSGITALDYASDGKLLISGASNGALSIWSVEGAKMVSEYRESRFAIVAIAYDRKNDLICVARTHGAVEYYKLVDGKKISFLRKTKTLLSMAFTVDYYDGVAAVGSTSGRIELNLRQGSSYQKKIDYMVNVIKLIPDRSPQIVAVAGTHGMGLIMMAAKDMKLREP